MKRAEESIKCVEDFPDGGVEWWGSLMLGTGKGGGGHVVSSAARTGKVVL